MGPYRSKPSDRACSAAGRRLRRTRSSSDGRTLAQCPRPGKKACSKAGRALPKTRTSKDGRKLNRCKKRRK